jgi:hypothetical protein
MVKAAMWASTTSLSTGKELTKTVAGGKRIDDPAVFYQFGRCDKLNRNGRIGGAELSKHLSRISPDLHF